VGLFLDQRENRLFMREKKPKSLLNLFAYTGAFSVAAAYEEATTTSIDLSKKTIERAKENFTLNNFDPKAHQFYADDVMKSLPRQEKRGAKYDCIILDPPTFSRSKETGVFQVEKEMPKLIKACLGLLNSEGWLLISTNCTELANQDLSRFAVQASQELKFKIKFREAPIPEDFSDSIMPSTLWVQVLS
jgi:23S rRNA (cytosine1962-C5)-methyltransferase